MSDQLHRNRTVPILLGVATLGALLVFDGRDIPAAAVPQTSANISAAMAVASPEPTPWGVEVAPALAEPTPPTVDPVSFVDLPGDIERLALWATDLFDEADLELPPLRFIYHGEQTAPCYGRPGAHHEVDGVSVVDLCITEASFATQTMVLHEVAHSWAGLNLTPERKAAFQELRGWEHWQDYEAAPWHDNGTEQAAEIMVWGLIDRPIRIVRIYQRTCRDLDTGYRTLTGAAPLHGYEDMCTGPRTSDVDVNALSAASGQGLRESEGKARSRHHMATSTCSITSDQRSLPGRVRVETQHAN